MPDNDNELLAMMGQLAASIAALSGVKTQFIEAGWSPEVAEWMVLCMLQKSGSGEKTDD